MRGSHNLKLLIKSVEDDEIGTIISKKKCDTQFPIVSCTKKHSENEMEQLTFLLNNSCIINFDNMRMKVKNILKANNIKEYMLNVSSDKISVILHKNYAHSILKQVHDKFILE